MSMDYGKLELKQPNPVDFNASKGYADAMLAYSEKLGCPHTPKTSRKVGYDLEHADISLHLPKQTENILKLDGTNQTYNP